ncbi:glycosyltransferase family 4 protein [Gottfriedia acidiceleris]|uniref:glycosyltransferase family 4 protein n=1 Tax=Gottfriedia acidiceleris TaxID=371036 RepID=UPI003D22AB66
MLLTDGYPSDEDLYRNAFVHQRVRSYLENGYKTDIWILNQSMDKVHIYEFEGITVYSGNEELFLKHIKENDVDRLLIHFLIKSIIELLYKLEKDIPIVIWVHLFEVIRWYRRWFEFTNFEFLRYINWNRIQLNSYKNFVQKMKKRAVSFIFVSEWIKNVAARDIGIDFYKADVVHNVINTDLFTYIPKSSEQRKKILLIRPFVSRKYANDIAVKSIIELSKHKEFNDMEFCIYGKGKYYKKLTKKLANFPNVICNNKFLKQNDISNLHKEFGIFLCPTRQDSQGVSMCEAMASGLVVATSNNTAIPEFVENNVSGLLSNNYKELADSILEVYRNPDLFQKISKQASEDIKKKCGKEATITREIEVIISTSKGTANEQ